MSSIEIYFKIEKEFKSLGVFKCNKIQEELLFMFASDLDDFFISVSDDDIHPTINDFEFSDLFCLIYNYEK